MMWTAIVVTCPHKSWCSPLEAEIRKITRLGGRDTKRELWDHLFKDILYRGDGGNTMDRVKKRL